MLRLRLCVVRGKESWYRRGRRGERGPRARLGDRPVLAAGMRRGVRGVATVSITVLTTPSIYYILFLVRRPRLVLDFALTLLFSLLRRLHLMGELQLQLLKAFRTISLRVCVD